MKRSSKPSRTPTSASSATASISAPASRPISNSRNDAVRELHAHNGLLIAKTAQVQKKTYSVHNVDPRAKTLIIEHPVRAGYDSHRHGKADRNRPRRLPFRSETCRQRLPRFPRHRRARLRHADFGFVTQSGRPADLHPQQEHQRRRAPPAPADRRHQDTDRERRCREALGHRSGDQSHSRRGAQSPEHHQPFHRSAGSSNSCRTTPANCPIRKHRSRNCAIAKALSTSSVPSLQAQLNAPDRKT